MSWKRTVHPTTPLPPETRAFERYLNRVGPGWFHTAEPVFVARAPARLDCMGGIADYCGSVVFEEPLAQATWVAIQPRPDRLLRVRSAAFDPPHGREWVGRLDDLARDGRPLDYPAVRRLWSGSPATAWAAYVIGCFHVLWKEGVVGGFPRGADLLVWSTTAMGEGVASSAALEVAAMQAIGVAYGLRLEGLALARLAQIVENRVVGAPCGIMDQVTSALGQPGQLLALRCQPHEVLGHTALPEGVALFGLSTRVKHSVAGRQYTEARVAAFMGHKIILHHLKAVGRDPYRGYLCNITPAEYRRRFRAVIPARITGEAFLRKYGPTVDPVTHVDPAVTYLPRSRTEHPIYENARVERFIRLIGQADPKAGQSALIEAGRLMYASHWSYSHNAGLGSAETDLVVRLVRRAGPKQGLYGAKITGGGSGGTVAILARQEAAGAVQRIAEEYQRQTGIPPAVFTGSSPGALAFGHGEYRWM